MTKLLSTKNYDLFKKHEANRSIDQCNLQKIINSIRAKNLLKFRPILVDENFKVLDGQHRLEAAKVLDVEIWYQINESSTDEEIILLNAHQKNWTIEDYLNFHVSKGHPEYIKILEYCKKNNMKFKHFQTILYTFNAGNSDNSKKFKSGRFTFPEGEYLDRFDKTRSNLQIVLDFLFSLNLSNKDFFKFVTFQRALISFLYIKDLNVEIFLKKLEYNIHKLHPCSDILGYRILFRDIYNWKNQNPLEFKDDE